jgi:HYR domain-containing protein
VKCEASCRRVRFLSFLVVLTCGSAVAQGGRSIEPVTHELARIELEGFVYEPAGTPAEGVVVVSSAGGKAVTDRDGAYRLDVHIPLGTRTVQVTAVGARGLVASAPAGVPSVSTSMQVPPLSLALGNSCDPSWLPTFGGMGTSDSVAALAVYDAGQGPQLYAAGRFLSAGGVPANRIARWDGSRWRALGAGLNGEARALAVYDDSGGPALFVGGSFSTAGGASASRLAKWDGRIWRNVGGGLGGSNVSVQALAVFDDGNGPALYAAGTFNTVGGVSATNIARWDGFGWSALGVGVNGFATSLAVHDDGSGPALFVGGAFGSAGGVAANRIARWNGTSWSSLGTGGNNGVSNTVYALAVYDSGGGAALHVGGAFTFAGTVMVNHIARWNGSGWSALGSGLSASVRALRAFDDGSGSKLWVGGSFWTAGGAPANGIATWNGSSWQAVGSGVDGGERFPDVTEVQAFCTGNVGNGTELFVGGRFAEANGEDVNNVARRVGSSFAGLGVGLSGSVRAVTMHDDGTGPALYAGGDFVTAEGVTLNHIGRWDGWSWTPLGSGMDGSVHALLVHDDGSGPALFAGGDFGTAGGVTASRIARWNGSSWSAMDGGLTLGGVRALAVHGGALYAGGTFLLAGGPHGTIPVNRIAKWDGTSWDDLGTGVNTSGGVVKALVSHDDGSGSRLYAGGEFNSVGDVSVTSLARWNGSFWSSVGGAFTNPPVSIDALAVYAGGLFAGGRFDQAGGAWAFNIARWSGTGWWELAGSVPQGILNERVLSLWAHDDGSGSKLYVGSNGGMARWNGSSWSLLGGGALGPVHALTTFDDGSGPTLFAGGLVSSFVDSGDSFLGEWGCDRLPPVITAPPVRAIDEPGNGPGEAVTFTVQVSDDHDPAPEVWLSSPSGSVFPLGTTMVTCMATDASGNESITEFPVTVTVKVRRKP